MRAFPIPKSKPDLANINGPSCRPDLGGSRWQAAKGNAAWGTIQNRRACLVLVIVSPNDAQISDCGHLSDRSPLFRGIISEVSAASATPSIFAIYATSATARRPCAES